MNVYYIYILIEVKIRSGINYLRFVNSGELSKVAFGRSNLLRLDSLVSGGPAGEKISGEQFLSATLITRSALRSN